MKANIVIIGGGIIGSSIAYYLAAAGNAGDIVVIERDSTYEHAATPRSNGGIRRLFSLPENIEIASYGLSFYKDFASTMAIAGERAEISFRRQGYLFISDNGGADQMEENYRLQESMGVEVDLLSSQELKSRFPSINTDDVDLAVLSDHDAWIDPHAALIGFRKKAQELGVRYVQANVNELIADASTVLTANVENGDAITGDVFVNACGAWCAVLAKTVDVHLPVEPMSRESYYIRCANELEPLPFMKSETDFAFRPEGQGYIGGVPDWAEKPGWNFDISPTYFNEVVWPMLAKRIPAMQEIRLERSWRGHYARSSLDCSPILGPVEGSLENLFLANGFSGHGIMHAPATGRGIAEKILYGQYQSIDLSCFGYSRVGENKPYMEKGIV